jgi:cephalosporin hydroxylase
MFPFWDVAIRPLIEASGAKRIVEIGALRGETTAFMLERLGADAELHVIDPVPAFDPAEHEARFPGRYIFHRDASLNVLLNIPPMDVALIDGDHNWYTVYNELKQLSTVARGAGAPLPLLIMHDVLWPYGRRDLYYEPARIPAEFRQPYKKKGLRPDRPRVVPRNGVNSQLDNAVLEGGPRNGVMTALDDFVAEYDRPLRIVVLPIYFGLAIVVEEEHLKNRPELAAELDRLEAADGRHDLLLLSEKLRLDMTLWQHNAISRHEAQLERAAARYLDLLGSALLDEHYLDNELRLRHLLESHKRGTPPVMENLRDPRRGMRPDAETRATSLENGRQGRRVGRVPPYFAYADVGRKGLQGLTAILDGLRATGMGGDLLDCGTGRGGIGIFMRGYLEAHELTKPAVWVADTFTPAPTPPDDARATDPLAFHPDLNMVREGFKSFHLFDDRVTFLQGTYSDTLSAAPFTDLSLVRLGDVDPSEATEVLDAVYDRLGIGGIVVIDDHEVLGPVVEEFRRVRGITEPLERSGWSTMTWRKAAEAPHPSGATLNRAQPAMAPLAPSLPDGPGNVDLSVVVVFYNMRREAPRTLHSLSRKYQDGIDALTYEVIAIDNGSSPEQRVDEALVRSFGPEFRYVDFRDEATASPVPALNRGIKEARGKAVALMIDGAHVLTPGVLHYGSLGLEAYAPAVVSTQQWYVGPGQQVEVMVDGQYDQAYEDTLFERIAWPTDGYRLFDIGHFIGDRDWFDGMPESNCLFVPRELLEQVGGFDEAFITGGGGYANLDLYERLASTPGVRLATILGEGSFHQVHGGTTTNQPVLEDRNDDLTAYAEQYEALRGHRFRGAQKPIYYVGNFTQSARRTRPRRLVAPHFFKRAAANGDGPPQQATAIPADLKDAFIDAYYDSLAGQKATWLDVPVATPPTDLFVYQELIAEHRPDVVVETGTGRGGRALYLAGVCDLVGHGTVISIDPEDVPGRPTHPRLTYVTGPPHQPDTAEAVRALIGDDAHGLVILGSRAPINETVAEFHLYSSLVPVGSYVIVEETVVNGHPVWLNFGAGPWEAVKQLTGGDFVSDASRERFGLTLNPRGFLKRVRPVG